MKNLYKKLFEAKKEIGKISKDSKNPFFKSKYFDVNSLLEHVEPILQKHSLLLLQPIQDGCVISEIIDIETGEKVASSINLTNINDAQKRGSEITYYRRYTLQSLLGLQAEDDDGNKAVRPAKVTPEVINTERLSVRLNACTTIDQLAATYKSFTTEEQKAMAALTNNLKDSLTLKTA